MSQRHSQALGLLLSSRNQGIFVMGPLQTEDCAGLSWEAPEMRDETPATSSLSLSLSLILSSVSEWLILILKA